MGDIGFWVWLSGALVALPILGVTFQKLDREVEGEVYWKPMGTEKTLVAAAVVAALWPIVLTAAVGFFVFVYPTLAFMGWERTKHEARVKAEQTEKAVLAKLEAEQKAEEAEIASAFESLQADEESKFVQGVKDELSKRPKTTAQLRAEAEVLETKRMADAVELMSRARRAGFTYSDISEPGFWKKFPRP